MVENEQKPKSSSIKKKCLSNGSRLKSVFCVSSRLANFSSVTYMILEDVSRFAGLFL